MPTSHSSIDLPKAPQGKKSWFWLGPAFLWMLSSAGSGELLFTPIIASQYGYAFLWALLLTIVLKWFINREIGRYTVCSGATFFSGIASLSRQSKWWLLAILVPQLVVAVSTVAGLSGAAAAALNELTTVPIEWGIVCILTAVCTLHLFGQYSILEKIMTWLAIVIFLTILVAAFSTGPSAVEMAKGLRPSVPPHVKPDEIVSWLGFMLAGAAGMMWFSYWLEAKGYGAAAHPQKQPLNVFSFTPTQQHELKRWVRTMTITNTLAFAGALAIAIAFLILGTELLLPEKLVPKEQEVVSTLGQLLGKLWGKPGYIVMIIAVLVTFLSTLSAVQDGFSRMFTDGILLLRNTSSQKTETIIRRGIILVVLGLLPLISSWIQPNPVTLLKLAGIIEACHIPVVTVFIVLLNRTKLPVLLRPSLATTVIVVMAGTVFALFAFYYLLTTVGILS